jgi:hypothetical protein
MRQTNQSIVRPIKTEHYAFKHTPLIRKAVDALTK